MYYLIILYSLECHTTLTGNNISVAEKLSIAQFCNTALITFLANYAIYYTNIYDLFTDGQSIVYIFPLSLMI